MRPDLEALGPLIHRADALARGCTERELRGLTRPTGAWLILRRGIYVPRAHWESLDDRGRLRLEARAASPRGDGTVVSHRTAARLHGLRLLGPAGGPIDLTWPGVRGTRRRTGARVRIAHVPDCERVEHEGLVLTTPARTAIDLGREGGLLAALVAADGAVREGLTSLEDLRGVLSRTAQWPGATRVRGLLDSVDPGAESAGETVAREVVRSLGLGTPETQAEIRSGGQVAYADLRLGRCLIEFDGRIKYARESPYSGEPASEVLWREKQREDWLRSLGWHVVRLTWVDLWPPRLEHTRERLREAITTFGGVAA